MRCRLVTGEGAVVEMMQNINMDARGFRLLLGVMTQLTLA